MNNAPDLPQPVFHESLDERIGELRGVHVWTHDLDAAGDAWLDRDELLSSDELSVAGRLRSPLARRRFVRSHVIARHLLAGVLQKPAGDIVFRRNRWGKPSVESPHDAALDFNFSHSDNAFLFSVCFGGTVGVDVETLCDNPDLLSIAESFFSPVEIASLRTAPPSEHRNLFFGYWTTKEASAKLSGRGFSADADSAEAADRRQRFQTTLCVGRNEVAAAIVWRTGHE
ncbi:MAG: 4'-phosphopantetheinyl transferase superfamily protein [Verrucomicrobia bacterium]|nr:4'-phosphopantetheinyl transferase superfamily protein [Verrucomicrobiota bacterium]